MFEDKRFWVLVAGLIAFVVKFLVPDFPFGYEAILMGILFLLGLFGIYPKLRLMGVMGATWLDLVKSLEFWTMLAGVIGFVVNFYVPSFPLTEALILALILFILKTAFGIEPSVLEYAVRKAVTAAEGYGGDKKIYAMNAAKAICKSLGYSVPDIVLDAYIESLVFCYFNDPVVNKLPRID